MWPSSEKAKPSDQKVSIIDSLQEVELVLPLSLCTNSDWQQQLFLHCVCIKWFIISIATIYQEMGLLKQIRISENSLGSNMCTAHDIFKSVFPYSYVFDSHIRHAYIGL